MMVISDEIGIIRDEDIIAYMEHSLYSAATLQ
jgi:hypothetical protein